MRLDGSRDTRGTTNLLKGLAILAVLLAHFFSNYDSDFYGRWLFEYAISIISIFFVLSGYGLYQSLERRFAAAATGSGRVLLRFAYDRAIRIYPFYWLSLICVGIFIHPVPDYDRLFEPNLKSLAVWLGAPVVHYTLLWFITAIIQCYWLAPLFYFLLKKLGVARYGLLMLFLTGLTLLVSWTFYLRQFALFHLPAMGEPQAYFFKGYFLGHLLLFAMGMMVAPLAAAVGSRLKHGLVFLGSAVLFSGLIYALRFVDFLFPHSELYLVPVLFASAVLFCFCAIAYAPRMPLLQPLVMRMGKLAFPLYLFHYQWFAILFDLGLIRYEFPGRSLAAFLISLPLFVLVLIALNAGVKRSRKWADIVLAGKSKSEEITAEA